MSTEGVAVHEFARPAVAPADPDGNVTDLLVARAAETPDRALFAIPEGDDWRDVTAAAFHDEVRALAKGLVAAGIEPGDRVGLMARTSYEWVLIDFAVWFAGAVLVPIYETSSPSQVQWNLEDSGAVAVIVQSPEHFARFDEVRPDLPLVRAAWQIDLGDLGRLVTEGHEVADDDIERRRRIAKGADIGTLIYTSGTTGRPKGCVLTHSNFVELTRNAQADLSEIVHPGASTLLFITTAHVFARFISVLCVSAGVRVGHQPDTTKLVPSLGTFKPTFLLAVPRVFEKVYNSAEQKAESAGKGRIFRMAAAVAVAHSAAVDAGPVPLGLRLRFALFDRLVYAKLRKLLGGRVEYAISGSAPLGDRLGHFYRSIGVNILEGYGLTETTAPISVNPPDRAIIGTVGIPLPGVAVRIGEGGEIEARGINIFDGYWRNEAATAESFDDGWFRTGDLGTLSEDGYITITGRKKEILVTAGGKNVAPAALEDAIRSNPVVGQVVVVGDQRPYIAALVTLDPEMLPLWLSNAGEDSAMGVQAAAKHPKVLAEVQRAVDAANATVSRAESIRRFEVLGAEFTEASGHLTPKLSIKRNVIVNDFADEIERIYSQAPTTQGLPTVR